MKWAYTLGLAALSGCVAPIYASEDSGKQVCASDSSCEPNVAKDAGNDGGKTPRDAEVRVDAATDAQVSMPPDANVSVDPAAALLGTYAFHARFYGRELSTGLVRNMHEIVGIAAIARNEQGAIKMTVTTCYDGGTLLTDLGPGGNVVVVIPAKYPVRVQDVTYEDGKFYTSGAGLAVGFTVASPAGCTPGGKLASSLPWMNGGMCQCASDDSVFPTTAQDCRVIDSDMDGTPGMKIASTGVVNSEDAVRIFDRSQFVEGVVVPGSRRHYASYRKDEDFLQLSCSDSCSKPPAVNQCRIEDDPVNFVPIDAQLSCEDVMRQKTDGQLFSGEQFTFPSGC